MVIKDQGELESENEEEVEDDDMPSLEDADNEQNAVVGDLLVARRVLNVQVMEEESNQRENLFHTRCFVNNKGLQCHYRWRELHKRSQHLFGGEIGFNYHETSPSLPASVAE
jgi:hypothetical protein